MKSTSEAPTTVARYMARVQKIPRLSREDEYALAAGKDDESSVKQLAQYLKKGAEDEQSKAWLLYCWVTDRIVYDVKSFLSGDYTKKDYSPANVLKERLAVCDGYSKLYTAIGKEMGLDAVSIAGHAKGFGYRQDIELDDKLALEHEKELVARLSMPAAVQSSGARVEDGHAIYCAKLGIRPRRRRA